MHKPILLSPKPTVFYIALPALAAGTLTAVMFFRWYFMGTFAHTFLVLGFTVWVVAPVSIAFMLYAIYKRKLARSRVTSLAQTFSPKTWHWLCAMWVFSAVLVAGVYLGDVLYAKGVRQARESAPALAQSIREHHQKTGLWPTTHNRLPAIAASQSLPFLAKYALIYVVEPPIPAYELHIWRAGSMMGDKDVSTDGVQWQFQKF